MYELFLPQMVSAFELPSEFDSWRQGKPLEQRPRATIEAKYSGTRPLPQIFRSLTPLFHADVLAFLREKGADNLETTEVHIEVPGKAPLLGWHATNVVGRISLAAFFGQLPAIDTFPERRRDALQGAMDDVAALVEGLTKAGQGLARPTAVIARLAEHNRPLLIRSDDVRFCSLYLGAGFYQLVADSIPRS